MSHDESRVAGSLNYNTLMLKSLTLLLETLEVATRLGENEMDAVEAYFAGADPYERVLADRAAGRLVPSEAVLWWFARCMQEWFESGAEVALAIALDDLVDDESSFPLDRPALVCFSRLAALQVDRPDPTEWTRDSAAEEFLSLANRLLDAERWDAAARAVGLFSDLSADSPAFADRSLEAARVAGAAGNAGLRAAFMMNRAIACAAAAEDAVDDREVRSEAILALLAAIRFVQDAEPGDRDHIVAGLVGVARSLDTPLLAGILQFAFAPSGTAGADVVRSARALTSTTWSVELSELLELIVDLAPLSTEVENLAFVPRDSASDSAVQLEASWTSVSFDHPSYRRAIPHSRSIFREGDIATIVYELVHEVTHIVCMLSGLIVPIVALRAAAVSLEITLWAHVPEELHDLAEDSTIAPISGTDILALAQAEQALEPIRCTRILQRVWTPWLEGVAVFNELASDPSEGDTSSLVGDVLANLVDVANQEGTVEAFGTRISAARTEIDEYFAGVLRDSATARLRVYLEPHWAKYGPGYLAVRAVVSAWRRTLGSKLTGTEAARILIHVSRYGPRDAVPDLSVGSERFRSAAERGMLTWVVSVAAMTKDDLEYARVAGRDWGWRDGRVIRAEELAEPGAQPTIADLRYLCRQAWSVLRGQRADTARVAGTVDESALMQGVAEALANATLREDVADSIARVIDDQVRILPVGTTRAPFWINESTKHLVLTLRTTEVDKDTGRPGYNSFSVPLSPEEMEGLDTELRREPERRIRVTRIADLTPVAAGPDRHPGRQFLALQFGEWLIVRNAGLFMSLSTIPDDLPDEARARLAPTAIQLHEAEICEGIAGADRTIRWIDRVVEWTIGDDVVPAENWAAHVRKLAVHVRDRDDEAAIERDAGEALLALVWGSDARTIATDGLRSVTDGDSRRTSGLIAHLVSTAREPASDGWVASLDADDELLAVLTDDRTDVKPVLAGGGTP